MPDAPATLVRCPCCQGYRDRGDGTHDHCGWCDDEGEVTPEHAAEYLPDGEPISTREEIEAAIVKWLRKEADTYRAAREHDDAEIRYAVADAIERRAHRENRDGE